MSVDDVVKLILAVSFALSLLGVSWQIGRLLSKVTDALEDSRTGIKNASKLSEMLVEDYDKIRRDLWNFISFFKNIYADLIEPIVKVFGFVSTVKSMVRKPDPTEKD